MIFAWAVSNQRFCKAKPLLPRPFSCRVQRKRRGRFPDTGRIIKEKVKTMSNMIQAAREQVHALTQSAYEKAAAAGVLPAGAQVKATIEIPKDVKNGDYASSFAMAGAKALHRAPRQIAQAIVEHLDLAGSYFDKVEIAGPGFLNFTLGSKWYADVLCDIQAEGKRYGAIDEGKGETVMVEFVSANPTGPMHIGNARGGVLGDALASVLERAGYDVWREFYVNDAGNQIHKFALSIDCLLYTSDAADE